MTPAPDDADRRYERRHRIATGGMGEVWAAQDTVLGREVAVKVLKAEYAADAGFRARFSTEARNAAALHHPGIASVFDYGTEGADGSPYLVMELVDGKPLSELVSGGRALDPERARELVLQVAEALAVAHAAGVVHRDVKPANLLVTPQGRVKITDFGIARATGDAAITRTGEIIGTPHYLSPEQASGRPATAASDVYALGVVLFECLAGRRPFVADTAVGLAMAHLRDDVPALPDTVPAGLAAVTYRALAKEPAERYADGAEVAQALREAADGGVPVAGPEPTRVMTAATAPATRPTRVAPVAAAAATDPDRERDRDRGTPWAAYAVAGLLALLLVLLLVTRPWTDDGDDTATTDPSPSASSTPSETASETAEEPATVDVDPDDFVGRPVGEVEAALAGLGLDTTTRTVENPGRDDEGDVAALSPTGSVDEGTTITLDVLGAEPEATPTPTPSPYEEPVDPDDDGGNGNGNGNSEDKGPDDKGKSDEKGD